ncbi:pseudouridine synthase [Aspergillus avenaceus]|uniref:Pseudouridine synthase n=1 Tax=Aspergillus avenaceus TaxID=36643 RepID=A0A5N6TMA5_ASPAV|nr:pseudouridine synthase [Aspergillus avenaceus]
MENPEIVESPRKRIKVDNDTSTEEAALPPAAAAISESDAQALREAEVGITEFVSAENEGFAGLLKKRYTDFLVNEILPSGEVLHLRNLPASQSNQDNTDAAKKTEPSEETKPQENTEVTPAADKPSNEEPPAPEFQLSDEDKALLESQFGDHAKKIVSLHKRTLSNQKARPSEFGKLPTVVVNDRDLRIQMHQAIRRIFSSQLESSTDAEGMMTISVAANRNKRKAQGAREGGRNPGGRVNWDELGGPYLHFTIHKENKDTMEVISFIARQLRLNPKSFQFAGTKDRRGVTVQRACATRVHADRLAKLNSTLRNAAVGDFEYRKHGLELGDLAGNEFVITLRECDIPGIDLQDQDAAVAKATELVSTALRNLRERGYFNYYGLQRFGTFATRTDTIGVKMLKGDFKGACDAILDYSPHVLAAAQEGESSTLMISSDDKARAQAIHLFQTAGKVSEAVEKLPRKFSAEANLIRQLGRSRNDYLGALQAIPRNLRLMYVHAYQSLVWNFAAGERWRLYGDKVVEGDLILIHEHVDKTESSTGPAVTVDADGEVIITPQADDSAYAAGDAFLRARPLTAAEAASGKYTIFDVVLPLPGFDILYPANAMTDFYKSFMGSPRGGGLDPFDMRRKWKDVSLSGSYRKFLSRMGPDYSADVKLYSQDDAQFVQTDLDTLTGQLPAPEESQPKDKVAVVLKFQLGSSQYATMALRELMRGKVLAYKPDFGGGR